MPVSQTLFYAKTREEELFRIVVVVYVGGREEGGKLIGKGAKKKN